jgi:hypothetical protein
MIATTDMHTIMEEMFCVWSMLKLYNDDQLPLQQSPEMAVRRVGDWCEMAASLQRHELRSRGTSTAGRHYQAAQ